MQPSNPDSLVKLSQNSMTILVPADCLFEIPLHIAKCPYCESKLYAQAHAWVEEDDGWVAEQLEVGCESEPDIESDEWDLWMHNHSYMPYVYQLPVNTAIENYINKNFRFKLY
jgi:hypothetical protein